MKRLSQTHWIQKSRNHLLNCCHKKESSRIWRRNEGIHLISLDFALNIYHLNSNIIQSIKSIFMVWFQRMKLKFETQTFCHFFAFLHYLLNQIVCRMVIMYLIRSSTAWMWLSKIDSDVNEYKVDCLIVDFSSLAINLSNFFLPHGSFNSI